MGFTTKIIVTLIYVYITSTISGCAGALTKVQDLPINIARSDNTTITDVPVYEAGFSSPEYAGIPIAMMVANGNGYADKQDLVKSLGKRGAKIGADFVYIYSTNVNQGPTVTSFGRYSALSSTIQTLSVYGTAYVRSPVLIGINWDQTNTISDVVPGSPADEAGLKIGERVLAFNGVRVSGNWLAPYEVLASSKPGDVIKIEVVNGSEQRVVDLIAGSNGRR